jgi:hypothetical protein
VVCASDKRLCFVAFTLFHYQTKKKRLTTSLNSDEKHLLHSISALLYAFIFPGAS